MNPWLIASMFILIGLLAIGFRKKEIVPIGFAIMQTGFCFYSLVFLDTIDAKSKFFLSSSAWFEQTPLNYVRSLEVTGTVFLLCAVITLLVFDRGKK